ncbi:S-layer homology domain-containing protein [Lederbergia sp. NSJ-179]
MLNGYPDNSFQPQKAATRAEAAVILSRLLH